MGPKFFLPVVLWLLLWRDGDARQFDYGLALSKAVVYFEAQRSGKLPSDQRVTWRGDSALKDGSDVQVDLTGGYYDAGDNVKFGFPLAFTMTTLAWSAVEFGPQLEAKKELWNTLGAIRWGSDYLIRAHAAPNILYGQVGDGDSDHACWQRPEDMTTPRTSYKIDDSHPGSDLAGETAAALAAASIVFMKSDAPYATTLLDHAKQLFDFANNHRGVYQNSIPEAAKFYSSSGFDDELLWAAAWLHRATGDKFYLDFLYQSGNSGGVRSMFSWDDKYVGVQALVSQLILEGKVDVNDGLWSQHKRNLEQFICSVVQKGDGNPYVKMSPGGMLWWQPWNNFQYTTSAMLVLASHADHLGQNVINCPHGTVAANELISFVESQVDYILGANPNKRSYMVGFGDVFPGLVHHRGASIPSIKKEPRQMSCNEGFDTWFNQNSPNPNVIDGAIVGGPDDNDQYSDSRSNFQQAETATVNNAPLVGVLARIA